jgi:hypothetical protein
VFAALGPAGQNEGAFFGLFLLGVIAAPWVANYMIMRRPSR